MPSTKILTQEERERVLANVRPIGSWRKPKDRKPFGNPPTPWEAKLGDLEDFRAHPGEGKAVVKVLRDPIKTQAIRTSLQNRLRVLYEKESWSTFIDGGYICLKFNGERRTYAERQPNSDDDGNGDNEEKKEGQDNPEDELFARTG